VNLALYNLSLYYSITISHKNLEGNLVGSGKLRLRNADLVAFTFNQVEWLLMNEMCQQHSRFMMRKTSFIHTLFRHNGTTWYRQHHDINIKVHTSWFKHHGTDRTMTHADYIMTKTLWH